MNKGPISGGSTHRKIFLLDTVEDPVQFRLQSMEDVRILTFLRAFKTGQFLKIGLEFMVQN